MLNSYYVYMLWRIFTKLIVKGRPPSPHFKGRGQSWEGLGCLSTGFSSKWQNGYSQASLFRSPQAFHVLVPALYPSIIDSRCVSKQTPSISGSRVRSPTLICLSELINLQGKSGGLAELQEGNVCVGTWCHLLVNPWNWWCRCFHPDTPSPNSHQPGILYKEKPYQELVSQACAFLLPASTVCVQPVGATQKWPNLEISPSFPTHYCERWRGELISLSLTFSSKKKVTFLHPKFVVRIKGDNAKGKWGVNRVVLDRSLHWHLSLSLVKFDFHERVTPVQWLCPPTPCY